MKSRTETTTVHVHTLVKDDDGVFRWTARELPALWVDHGHGEPGNEGEATALSFDVSAALDAPDA